MSIFSSIGTFFSHIFNDVKKVWDSFEPELQAAVTKSSTILAIVNQNINAAPADVFALISSVFPGITETEISSILNKGMNVLQNIQTNVSPDLATTLQNYKVYMANVTGNNFVTIMKALVTIGADLLAPNVSIIQRIYTVLDYVYETLVKPKVTALPAASSLQPAS